MSPLDKLLKDKRDSLKLLKADYKEAKKARNYTEQNNLQKSITETERFIKQFSKVNMDPRKVEDIVINYKLYTRFIKKLKGFDIQHFTESNRLIIYYFKSGGNKGNLQLYDIAHFFPEGSVFPEGELHGES